MDVSGFVIDLVPLFTVAGVVFTALAAIFVIRKIIGTANKS